MCTSPAKQEKQEEKLATSNYSRPHQTQNVGRAEVRNNVRQQAVRAPEGLLFYISSHHGAHHALPLRPINDLRRRLTR